MKTLLFIALNVLLILYSSTAMSQPFLVDGVEWHYSMTVWQEPGYHYNRVVIDGDKEILGKQCKVLKRSENSCDGRKKLDYIYEDGEKIYAYDEGMDEFLLLFDYGAEVGDTLTIPYWSSFYPFEQEDQFFHIRIDSTDIINYDTLSLKRFYVSYDVEVDYLIDFGESAYQGIIIEEIGSLLNFFHFEIDRICDGNLNVGLRCFSHPVHDTIMFQQGDCNASTFTTSIRPVIKPKISVHPNPTSDILYINAEVTLWDMILYSVDGRVLDTYDNSYESINLSSRSKGIYFLSFRTTEGAKIHKIIKN